MCLCALHPHLREIQAEEGTIEGQQRFVLVDDIQQFLIFADAGENRLRTIF